MIEDITTENHNLRLMLLQEMHDRINVKSEMQAAQKDTTIKNEELADEAVVEEVSNEYDAEEELDEVC